jgi:hypothetical protein
LVGFLFSSSYGIFSAKNVPDGFFSCISGAHIGVPGSWKISLSPPGLSYHLAFLRQLNLSHGIWFSRAQVEVASLLKERPRTAAVVLLPYSVNQNSHSLLQIKERGYRSYVSMERMSKNLKPFLIYHNIQIREWQIPSFFPCEVPWMCL